MTNRLVTMSLPAGLLGAAATVVLAPNALVATIACGILVACLIAAAVRALRRASHRIDRILAEEPPRAKTTEQPRRKAA